ncbi:MAG TPA: glycosyltransferase family 1 protein [Desulfonatronum sp.]|nr:glycosyltransferase family 1 protein [Desulfonatronum sp.]
MNATPRITVLHVCEHFGGREASLHGVARGFQWWMPNYDARRFRVLLCSRKGYDKAAEMMIQKGIQPLYLGYGKFDPRNLTGLTALIRREGVDVLHAHGYGASTWSRLAGLVLKRPVIIHERCNYGTVPLYQRPVERLFGPHTRYALAVSESTRRFCITKRYMPPEAVQVLYNGILLDTVEQVDPAWIAEFRKNRGVAARDKIVGIVGRLEPHKGLDDAVRALSRLRQANSADAAATRLWIVGDGGHLQDLRAQVQTLGMESQVDFLGFRPDVLRVIQCFDVQLFPSHMEGTPNTLFEALAVGNAIVASTIDGQGEILEHDKTGLLFAPGDDQTMAAQLARVLGDPKLARFLREQALLRSKDFDGRKTIRAMESLYERAVAQNRRFAHNG